MNKGFIFLAGAGLGSVVTYLIMNKRMEAQLEDEIRKYREDFRKRKEKRKDLDDPNAKNADGSIKEETVSYKDASGDTPSVTHYTHYASAFKPSGSQINISKAVTREVESTEASEEDGPGEGEIAEINEDGSVNVILLPNDSETLLEYEERAKSTKTFYYSEETFKFYKNVEGEETGVIECDKVDIPFDVEKDAIDFSYEPYVHLWDGSTETLYVILPMELSRKEN